ncbi:MAG TPA: peptidase M6 [Actinomycetota bacterium]|jgi:M6 family metalloprotease-like protein
MTVNRRSSRFVTVAIAVLALAVPAAPAAARPIDYARAGKGWPAHVDPQSWVAPEDMTWADYQQIPGLDWKDPAYQAPKTLRAALVLGDFTDQKFRVVETTRDPTDQFGLGVKDPAKYWVDLLFKDTSPSTSHRGHTVGEYWLENSYGLIDVDAEGFGPYTMDGKMYEYGITDFGDSSNCPDGPDGCSGDFDTEIVQKSLADVTTSQQEHGQFDFRFLLHAGYDESGVWLNYGIGRFKDKEDVTDEFGPADPKHRNWANTRYVEWTSFFAAQNIWSHALPGTLATEGESDGGSVYAHELSHVLGVLDNYNNPYAEGTELDRAYSGPWDMMSRGTFNGPGGPLERYTIPPSEGTTMGSHHMLRNKLRMGFVNPAEVLTVTREALSAGPVRTSILQRESPPDTARTNVFTGLRVVLGEDRSTCDANEPKCDEGGYDFYDVEVVNRQGFDSFVPDHGVLIAKSKAADVSPFIWVIDSHPKNLRRVDYVRADGKKFYYTVGDYRQLADAAFHAGTAKGVVNSYVDEANELAFFVLDKHNDEGRVLYDVAVQSLAAPGATEATVEKKSGASKKGKVSPHVFTVTNSGAQAGVFRLTATKKGGKIKTRLLNDLLYLDGGASQDVTVYALGSRRAKVGLKAGPAIAPAR